MGICEAVEVLPGLTVTSERVGQIGRDGDFAWCCVECDIDIDLIPGSDASGGAVLRAERDEETTAHGGDRGAVGVATDCHLDGRTRPRGKRHDDIVRDQQTSRRLLTAFNGGLQSYETSWLTFRTSR